MEAESTKGTGKPACREGRVWTSGLKPYRGKPAVRNFTGGDGNVGIIWSPLRAIALPDHKSARTGSKRGATSDGRPYRDKYSAEM